jgi:molybdopterin converting factor small subunit
MGGISTESLRIQDGYGLSYFGVPRLLTGQRAVDVASATLQDVVAALASECPSLAGLVIDPATGWLRGGYTFVVDERFTRNPSHPVAHNPSVLLVSSVSGG